VRGAGESDFKVRWDRVLDRVEQAARWAGRDPNTIQVVAVSKGVPVECLREAWDAGCRTFGESRVQEALAKMEALGAGPTWHLIGPLQANKVRAAVGRFSLIQAVDRVEVAERLDRVARERGLIQTVLLEVNIAEEPTKHGFSPRGLMGAVEQMGSCAGLRVLGLMAIPPAAVSPEVTRSYFKQVRQLAAHVEARRVPGISMTELSLGMSGDFDIAIEEGATMVRIGTALFGPHRGEGKV